MPAVSPLWLVGLYGRACPSGERAPIGCPNRYCSPVIGRSDFDGASQLDGAGSVPGASPRPSIDPTEVERGTDSPVITGTRGQRRVPRLRRVDRVDPRGDQARLLPDDDLLLRRRIERPDGGVRCPAPPPPASRSIPAHFSSQRPDWPHADVLLSAPPDLAARRPRPPALRLDATGPRRDGRLRRPRRDADRPRPLPHRPRPDGFLAGAAPRGHEPPACRRRPGRALRRRRRRGSASAREPRRPRDGAGGGARPVLGPTGARDGGRPRRPRRRRRRLGPMARRRVVVTTPSLPATPPTPHPRPHWAGNRSNRPTTNTK